MVRGSSSRCGFWTDEVQISIIGDRAFRGYGNGVLFRPIHVDLRDRRIEYLRGGAAVERRDITYALTGLYSEEEHSVHFRRYGV